MLPKRAMAHVFPPRFRRSFYFSKFQAGHKLREECDLLQYRSRSVFLQIFDKPESSATPAQRLKLPQVGYFDLSIYQLNVHNFSVCRYILLQFLILFQYLKSNVKFKTDNQVIRTLVKGVVSNSIISSGPDERPGQVGGGNLPEDLQAAGGDAAARE